MCHLHYCLVSSPPPGQIVADPSHHQLLILQFVYVSPRRSLKQSPTSSVDTHLTSLLDIKLTVHSHDFLERSTKRV
ncbi:hypothetical protein F2P81_005022 [Scophthalmus maximus]|uniref:Uncharacterized protein n=1 Tax=Scophthalmus maximus TaxID=52904 RepID=A0A6A4TEP8_SCOMX|nr:hypothetical protein F2P81_005022 [Scophthalmus maximus]